MLQRLKDAFWAILMLDRGELTVRRCWQSIGCAPIDSPCWNGHAASTGKAAKVLAFLQVRVFTNCFRVITLALRYQRAAPIQTSFEVPSRTYSCPICRSKHTKMPPKKNVEGVADEEDDQYATRESNKDE